MIHLGMIVRDELPMLTKTVPIYAPFFQHKWALDTGSQDGTVEYLRKQGFVVVCTEWHNDYSKARNTLLDLKRIATTEGWLFFLDADECIYPNQLIPELETLILNSPNAHLVKVPRINLAHNCTLQDMEIHPNWAPRLVRLASTLTFTGAVHEDCITSDIHITHATNHIYHYGWCKPVSTIAMRNENYDRISDGVFTRSSIAKWMTHLDDNLYWQDIQTRRKMIPFTSHHPLDHIYGRNQQSTTSEA